MESTADSASARKKPRRSAGPGALTALTLRLAKKFAAEGENVIFSPVSIYSALSLIASGACGDTLDELLSFLGAASCADLAEFVRSVAERALADGSASGGPHVSFACGMFHDETRPLKPAYRETALSSYKAETRAVDFIERLGAAVDEINAWVDKATHNLITEVVNPQTLSSDTRLVLANAIYFKGKWEKPFSEDRTKVEKFHLLDGTDIDAPMMRKDGGRQVIAVHDGFKVLVLPYRSLSLGSRTKFHMCVFLPNERDGLLSLVDKVASGPGDFLHDHLPTDTVDVGKLRLPKFKMNFYCKLTEVLKDMGLNVTFDPVKVDLSDMAEDDSSGEPLVLKDVYHKAVIEVNEEGTKAAAVSYSNMVVTPMSQGHHEKPQAIKTPAKL